MKSRSVQQMGAILSDLVAGVYALITENETGELLNQRLRELKASCDSLMMHAERIAKEREIK